MKENIMSQDELMEKVFTTIREWVDEEMGDNEGSEVTRAQRYDEHTNGFLAGLTIYLNQQPVE